MKVDQVKEDVWITSVCANCFSFCPIKAHRVNGVVVKIEGNPDDPLTQGRICARGLSGINILYDPNRLDYPVKRTNPVRRAGASTPSGSGSPGMRPSTPSPRSSRRSARTIRASSWAASA